MNTMLENVLDNLFIFATYNYKNDVAQSGEKDTIVSNEIDTNGSSKKDNVDSSEKDTTVSTDDIDEHCPDLDEETKEMIRKQKEFDELKEWADNIPVLKKEDDKLIKQLKDFVKQQKDKDIPADKIVDQFYRVMAMPLQLPCTVGKWMGNATWYDNCGSWEGETYACLDNIHWDSVNDQCIVKAGVCFTLP
jgi:hypothetical protein